MNFGEVNASEIMFERVVCDFSRLCFYVDVDQTDKKRIVQLALFSDF